MKVNPRICAALLAAAFLASCSGATHKSLIPIRPAVIEPICTEDTCGAGGGVTAGDGYMIPSPFTTVDRGYADTATRIDDYNESGSSKDSSGQAFGTVNGQISTDVSNGQDTQTLTYPSLGLNNYTYTTLDPEYFDFTQSSVDTGNGVVLSLNQTDHTVSTSVTVIGVTDSFYEWPDDSTGAVNLQVTYSDGTSDVFQFNGNDYLPPDPTTTESVGIRPTETCTAGMYCQWSITAEQGAAIAKAAAGFFSFCAITGCGVPPNALSGPERQMAALAAAWAAAAAADLNQQAAQQKKKKGGPGH